MSFLKSISHRIHNPALLLILLSPLVELFGNTPPIVFFNPLILLFFIFIYGFVALVIRELAIRWKLGLPGIFLMGLAYGIFNEGVAAKTLLYTKNVPIPTFDNYGIFFGIGIPWLFFITLFHALHSILYPILLVYFLYPEQKDTPWISRKMFYILGGIAYLAGVLLFLNKQTFNASPVYLLIFSIVIALLLFLSRFLPKSPQIKEQGVFQMKSFLLGILFFFFYIALFIISSKKMNLMIYFMFYLVSLWVFYALLKKIRSFTILGLLLFGMGSLLLTSMLAIIGYLGRGSVDGAIMNVFFIGVFIVALFKLRKKFSPQTKNS